MPGAPLLPSPRSLDDAREFAPGRLTADTIAGVRPAPEKLGSTDEHRPFGIQVEQPSAV
jgi:hypothetical protein